MTLPRLLLEVRLCGLQRVTWEYLDHGVRCSIGGDEDFSATAKEGRAALEKMLRRLRVI